MFDRIDDLLVRAGIFPTVHTSLIDVDPTYVRQTFDTKALNALAGSIERCGMQCPVSVRTHPAEAGRYILVHGARRLRAAKQIGLMHVPAVLHSEFAPIEVLALQLLHAPLLPKELTALLGQAIEQGMSQAQIARALGRSPAWVSMSVARSHHSVESK